MPKASTSQILIEAVLKTDESNLAFFRKMREQLGEFDLLLPKSNIKLQQMLQTAVTLSKTPFLSRESLEEAGRIIDILGRKLIELQEKFSAMKGVQVPASLKENISKTTADFQLFVSGYEGSLKRIDEIDKAHGNVLSQQQKDRLRYEQDYANAYQINAARNMAYAKMQQVAIEENHRRNVASAEQLARLETQRQALLVKTYALQRKSVGDVGTQQQLLDVATRIASAKLATPTGMADFEKAKKDLAGINAALIEHEAKIGIIGRAWEKFRMIFVRVFDALIAFTVINWAQRLFVGFFQGLIKSNELLENVNARLRILIPTTQEFKAAWDTIRTLTLQTPFNVEQVVNASVLIRNFGVDISNNMRVIADWASATNKDLQDTALAFAKIVSFSPRTALLLTTRGFSVAALESYVARFGDRTIALNRLINDTFGGTAQRISNTFAGLLTNISDSWTLLSQKLGQPLFEGLKDDLRTIFNLMNRFNKSGNDSVAWMAELINVITRVAIFTVIGTALAGVILLLGKIPALITSIRLSWLYLSSTTKLGISLSPLITALGFILIQWIKVGEAIRQVKEAEERFANLSKDDFSSRITEEENIIQNLESQVSWWNTLADVVSTVLFEGEHFWEIEKKQLTETNDALRENVRLWKEKREQDREAQAQKLRELLIQNSLGDAVRDYDKASKVAGTAAGDLLKDLLPEIQKEQDFLKQKLDLLEKLGVAESTKVTIGANQYTARELKDLIATKQGYINYLSAINSVIPKEEYQKAVLDDLAKKTLGFNKAMTGGPQAFELWREGIDHLIDAFEKGDKGGANFELRLAHLRETAERTISELARNQEIFKSLLEGETPRESKIEGYKKELDKFLNFFEDEKVIREQINETQIRIAPRLVFDEKKFDKNLIELTKQAADKYKIPKDIFLRQIKQESFFMSQVASSAGAVGLGQLMPDTARGLGLRVDKEVDERLDAAKNLDASAKYLSQLYNTFKSWDLALAAYNAGPGNVKKYGGIPNFKETLTYVSTILGNIDEQNIKIADDSFVKNFGIEDYRKLLADVQKDQVDLEELFKKSPKEIGKGVRKLIETARISSIIQQLLSAQSEEFKAQKELIDQINNRLGDQKEKITGIKEGLDELKFERGIISAEEHYKLLNDELESFSNRYKELTKEINQKRTLGHGLTGTQYLENLAEEQKLQGDINTNLTKQQKAIKAINDLAAPTWALAWDKQLQRLRKSTELWREELAGALIDAAQATGKSILTEIIFGTKGQDIDKQIADARFEMAKANADQVNSMNELIGDKTRISIIDDKERNALERINELERERGRIVIDVLLENLKKVTDKLEEIAINKIIASILPEDTALNEKIKANDQMILGATNLIELDNVDLAIAIKRLEIEKQISVQKSGGRVGEDILGIIPKFLPSILNIGGAAGGSPVPAEGGYGISQNVHTDNIEYLTRNTTTTHKSEVNAPIVFNGDIYGMDDFTRKVGQAQKELKRNLISRN